MEQTNYVLFIIMPVLLYCTEVHTSNQRNNKRGNIFDVGDIVEKLQIIQQYVLFCASSVSKRDTLI